MNKLAYSIAEAVEVTSIGRNKIYEAIAAGTLVARKEGKRTLILAQELSDYLLALPKTTETSE